MFNESGQNLNQLNRVMARLKLPLLFWLLMTGFAIFLVAISSYLIEQNKSRVLHSAELSANSIALSVSDYVVRHQQMVKFISEHHHESIIELSQGRGNQHDLDEIISSIGQLFPKGTEFAITNHLGDIVIGSDIEKISSQCRAWIKKSMGYLPSSPSEVQVHLVPNGRYHFDVMSPIQGVQGLAVLWMKISLRSLKPFVDRLNLEEYELIITGPEPASNILLGQQSQVVNLERSLQLVGAKWHSESVQESMQERELASFPIAQVGWKVRVLEKDQALESFANKVQTSALLVFFLVFIIVAMSLIFVKRLKIERESLKLQAVHDELFNAGPTILLDKKTDSKMSIIYVSPNAKSLFGTKAESLVGKAYLDWIHVDHIDEIKQRLLEAYRNQEANVELVYRIATAEPGGYKWIYDLTHVVYSRCGKPKLLRGYITSIHAQRTAEQNATNLIQSVPEAIFVTTLSGEIVETNHAAEMLLGCTKLEFHKQFFSRWLEFESFDNYEHLKKGFLHQNLLLKESESVPGNVVLMDKSGRKINVEINFKQIELNGTTLLVQVVRDVTLQLRTQQQLRLAKEEAEALAVARSRFVATISHEIRTPMNGVLGMTDLLFDTEVSPQQSQYLHAIKQSGSVLLQIINEVLDFAKLEEGQVQLVEEKLNLKEVISETMHLLSSSAEEKSLAFKLDYDCLSEYFFMDKLRLQQLLMNLISNAIKFTAKGSVTVRVESLDTDVRQSRHLTIKVIDTGIGIETANQKGLFESFTQADASTSRQFGGTGLGLAICRQLVELMHGQIGVFSELGKGSQFWIEIPVRLVQVDQSKAIEYNTATTSGSSAILEGKQVLLIEDNEINQRVIEVFLQRLGAQVDIAENGLIGLDYWRLNSQKYQLILMDCQMPVMDGYEATRLIRKEERAAHPVSHIPIVALTANAMQHDRDKCLQSGMDDFLAKPIERESFASMMLRWCL